MLNVRSIKSADFKGHFSADFGQIYPNFGQTIFFNKKSIYSAFEHSNSSIFLQKIFKKCKEKTSGKKTQRSFWGQFGL